MFKQTIILVVAAGLVGGCSESQPDNSTSSAQAEPKLAVTPPQEDLDTATFNGNLEAIKQHIAAGTDLNEKLGEDGHTALITATTLDHVDIVRH